MMVEKPRTPLALGTKPIPMKVFATCELDRSPPNSVPRLCSLTLSRLIVLKPLGLDVSTVSIAIKIQGSKRTLRSNDMSLDRTGHLDTDLQFHFSLQYLHLLKRKGNKLHLILQRRKKYKNKTFLGYKNLAHGFVNMCLALQKPLNLDLDLVNDRKCKDNNAVARVTINSLSSQPIDLDIVTKRELNAGDFSDDEDIEVSSIDELSDSDPMIVVVNKTNQGESRLPRHSARQRNLKQKFISLIKKFRMNEDFQNFDTNREIISRKLKGAKMNQVDIENLFKELELTDSNQDLDTMSSVSSGPKPCLPPFFTSTVSLTQDAYSGSDTNLVGRGQEADQSQTHHNTRPKQNN